MLHARLQLLEALKGLSRGANASAEQKEEVDRLASALERLNPDSKTVTPALLSGKWRLLYTTSASILGANRPALFRPSGPIYQTIGVLLCTARSDGLWAGPRPLQKPRCRRMRGAWRMHVNALRARVVRWAVVGPSACHRAVDAPPPPPPDGAGVAHPQISPGPREPVSLIGRLFVCGGGGASGLHKCAAAGMA